jgi:ankyrin repeat protein
MIDFGIDVNSFVDDNSALLVASSNGKTEIVRKLLDSGANPNLCDSLGNSFLLMPQLMIFLK